MDPLPLRLEDLFFPLQSVRANPQHDLAGARDGTLIKISQQLERVEGQPGKYVVNVAIQSDDDASTNAPYVFAFEAYAVLAVQDGAAPQPNEQGLALLAGTQIVVGAVRERLADLTSRAPWGRFLLNVVNVVAPKPPANG